MKPITLLVIDAVRLVGEETKVLLTLRPTDCDIGGDLKVALPFQNADEWPGRTFDLQLVTLEPENVEILPLPEPAKFDEPPSAITPNLDTPPEIRPVDQMTLDLLGKLNADAPPENPPAGGTPSDPSPAENKAAA